MNRVSRRASALLILVLFLCGGLGYFIYEYAVNAESWVVSPGSPHVYNSNNIGCGQVVDRNGDLLLDITAKRAYSTDQSVRMATMHLLGDRQGRISAPAIAHYGKEMTGYDMIDGLYSYDGSAGQAVLTVSAKVQAAALEAMGDRKGTIGVYNYKTGEILCMVTTPTYDPDQVPDIEGDETGAYEGVYLNRFTQTTYIPGSIYKIVTLAAALEEFPDAEAFAKDPRGFDNVGDWRRDNVNLAIEQVHNTIMSIKPEVQFGISPFGIWRNKKNDPRGSETSGLQNYDQLYADILLWMEKGWIDYVVPQLYWEIGKKVADYEVLAKWWAQFATDKCRVYIGMAPYRLGAENAASAWRVGNEVCRQLRLNQTIPGITGECYFRACDLLENRYNLSDSLKQVFYPTYVPAPR